MKVKKQILVLFLTMLVEIPILSAPKQKRTKKTKGGSCRKDYYIKGLQDKCRYLHSSI